MSAVLVCSPGDTGFCCYRRVRDSSPSQSGQCLNVRSLGRSSSGCMHPEGDGRATFHALAFAITLSVLVSNLEERDLREIVSPTQKSSQLEVKMQIHKRGFSGN